MPASKAVLITGCSSGIGRATAERLAGRGWRVYASARKVESIDDLEGRGCRVVPLDVSDEDSMKAAVAVVEEAEGAVGVLVNNAGYGLHGAMETTPLEAARAQFEVNFFGAARLTQMVLPAMRRQKWGRVVNVSSMGGKLTLPGGAFYHASKHALEAFSDALRYEVRPLGIDVVVIEPGLIKTRFGDTAVDTVVDATGEGPYDSFNRILGAKIHGAYGGALSRFASSPHKVAKVIERAISSRRPRTRYPVTAGARALLAARALLPDRAFDGMLRRTYPSPEAH